MPIISSEGEIEYRTCCSLSCHNKIPTDWVVYKLHKLEFHHLGGGQVQDQASDRCVICEALFPGSQMSVFSLCAQMAGESRELSGSLSSH